MVSRMDRTSSALKTIGTIGLIAAFAFGISGWMAVQRAGASVTGSIGSLQAVVSDLSSTVNASTTLVTRTREAVESIEDATRSSARAVDALDTVLAETALIAEEDVAASLDDAVAAFPALISTGRVIHAAMTTLSFVGVEYDPEVPLDQSLADLHDSLAPLPDQIRQQSQLINSLKTELDSISSSAGTLAGVLLETRIDMLGVEEVLLGASDNASQALASVSSVEDTLGSVVPLSKAAVVAMTLALALAAAVPLVIARSRESA